MQYNKRKHLKLLKSSPKLESPRRSLTDEEFVKFLDSMPIADENFFELEKYSAMMISHLHWENREHYFEHNQAMSQLSSHSYKRSQKDS